MRNDAAATVGRVDMRIWFGFRRLPFSQEVKADEMFLRPCMEEVCDRVAFAAQQGLMFAVIGDVGAGKSTALRYTFSRLPKKQYSVLQMTGGSWSFTELLRSCSNSMNVYTRTSQQTMMLKQIADGYASIRESGATPLLFIDDVEDHRIQPKQTTYFNQTKYHRFQPKHGRVQSKYDYFLIFGNLGVVPKSTCVTILFFPL